MIDEGKPRHENPMHPDNDAHDGTDKLCLAAYGRMPCARDYIGGSESRMLYDAAGDLAEARRILTLIAEKCVEPEDAPTLAAACLKGLQRGKHGGH